MIVSSTAQLFAALKVAVAGSVISLAPGSYSGVKILSTNFSGPVTITSADPAHPAILPYLGIANSSNITFSGLEMTIVGSADPYYPFRIQDSKNLTFTGMDIHGDPAKPAWSQKAAFYVITSDGITFKNSKFSHLGAGIVANNNTHVDISDNIMSEINKGGIEMGGCSYVTINNNTFTNFQVSRGTHPDAIQIYTERMKEPAHDISIVGNRIERGEGHAMQGIFVQDEAGNLPFHNVRINNNVILGGMWDSLYLRHATGMVEVKNNTVMSWPGLDIEGGGTDASASAPASVTAFAGYLWLRGDMSGATVTVTGNAAQSYQGPVPPGNKLLPNLRAAPSPAMVKAAMASNAAEVR